MAKYIALGLLAIVQSVQIHNFEQAQREHLIEVNQNYLDFVSRLSGSNETN